MILIWKMIVADFKYNYPYDPQRLYDFTPYLNLLKNISFYYGFGPTKKINDETFKVKLIVEYPNLLYLTNDCLNIDDDDKYFDLIFCICPFTCNLLNHKFNTTKYIPCFFPLQELKYEENERPIPVYYSGHSINYFSLISKIENTVKHFIGEQQFNNLKKEISIHNTISYFKKLEIYSKTKICIVHNLLFKNLPNMNAFINNEMYNYFLPWHTNSQNYVPQIKSRMFEGAMMGCILLVYKDEYNLIENFFTENEDFIYFTDEIDLKIKIEKILSNYDDYKFLAENAKKKFYEKYTFKHFIDLVFSNYQKFLGHKV